MPSATHGRRVRLAELVAVLSLGTNLGLGEPMEHVLRQRLIALRLADRLGLDEAQRAVVYYCGLVAWMGCHVDAYEQAKWFGDDLALKGDRRPPGGPHGARVRLRPPRSGPAAAGAGAPGPRLPGRGAARGADMLANHFATRWRMLRR